MRKLIKASIFVFAFCFSAFAQADVASPCPTISLTGPAGIAQPNESIRFTLSIDEKAKNYDIKYNWTISTGKITGGQGTTTLSILPDLGEGVTAAIEISGLPSHCPNTVSEVYMVCDVGASVILIDEFSESISRIDNARIEAITAAVANNPNAQLYIVSTYKRRVPAQNVNKNHEEIADVLTKAGIEKGRITFVYGDADANLTKIFLVPPGAIPPKIESN